MELEYNLDYEVGDVKINKSGIGLDILDKHQLFINKHSDPLYLEVRHDWLLVTETFTVHSIRVNYKIYITSYIIDIDRDMAVELCKLAICTTKQFFEHEFKNLGIEIDLKIPTDVYLKDMILSSLDRLN